MRMPKKAQARKRNRIIGMAALIVLAIATIFFAWPYVKAARAAYRRAHPLVLVRIVSGKTIIADVMKPGGTYTAKGPVTVSGDNYVPAGFPLDKAAAAQMPYSAKLIPDNGDDLVLEAGTWSVGIYPTTGMGMDAACNRAEGYITINIQ